MSENIPTIESSRKFNFFTSIWIVPFMALLIAMWLAYQYFSELGPQIRIVFPKNEGLKVGQSQIKYRDVPVGVINKIELQKDGEGVVVVARMDKTVTPYINKNSKFWIVKPEVGIRGISGLDTLISGTYIDMFAEKDDDFKDEFIGLDYAYRNTEGGEYFILNTPRGDSSVKEGTPIYLKNVKVGQVEYVVLALDDASVDVIIFIDKLYVPYIHEDSNFWVRSTMDVGYENGNFDLAVSPITDLIQGAIEFSTSGKNFRDTVMDGYVFSLYKNKNDIQNNTIGKGKEYVKTFILHTDVPVARLKANASIHFADFKVGEVKKIKLFYQQKTHTIQSKIILEIDTSIFDDGESNISVSGDGFYQAMKEGLKAQIVASDPISGRLHVNLLFDDTDINKTIIYEDNYAVLATINDSSDSIMKSISSILDKINNLKLEKLIASMDKVVKQSAEPVENANNLLDDLRKIVGNIHKMTEKKSFVHMPDEINKSLKNINKMTARKSFLSMPDEVNKTLKNLTKVLKTTEKVVRGYKTDSLLSRQLAQTLKIVTKTSQEMQQFLKMLNRKPNSLIFGD